MSKPVLLSSAPRRLVGVALLASGVGFTGAMVFLRVVFGLFR